VHEDVDAGYPEIYGGRVILVLKDGSSVSRHVEYSRGMPENPMPHAEVERKFLSLAGAAVGQERAAEILARANGLFAADSAAPLNELLATYTVAGLLERSH
jgi:2-methylcitrate dehydratase PrpD